jgi:hypothetical protein
LKGSRDAGGDESCRNKVLSLNWIKIESTTSNSERRRNNRSDNGEGVLETEDERQKDWDAVIQAVERVL